MTGLCEHCNTPLLKNARKDCRFCGPRCRRDAFRERATTGRVASVRRLKSGKMSVTVHVGDAGLKPGDVVKIGAGDG